MDIEKAKKFASYVFLDDKVLAKIKIVFPNVTYEEILETFLKRWANIPELLLDCSPECISQEKVIGTLISEMAIYKEEKRNDLLIKLNKEFII